MAVAPGVYFVDRAVPPPRSAPTDTGVAFMVGLTTEGPLEATEIRSLATFESVYGARDTDGYLYDAVDVALREGVGRIYVARLVGPAGTDLDDDRINVVDASYEAALDRLPRSLGPGQVLVPGESSATIHALMLDHAAATNRVAMLDAPDSDDAADLIAAAAAARAHEHARYGAMWGPWVTIRGLLPGTTRRIPYAPVQAGITARNDVINTANVPAAGHTNGIAVSVLDVGETYTDEDRADLNEAGVNIAIHSQGRTVTYGYRSLVAPADPTWLMFSNVRFRMELQAVLEDASESFVFSEIDGKGKTLAAYGGAISGVLLPYYTAGSLYGDTPDEAFVVDTSPAVNPPEQLAGGEMRAAVGVRMSPFGERVFVELAKAAITEVL